MTSQSRARRSRLTIAVVVAWYAVTAVAVTGSEGKGISFWGEESKGTPTPAVQKESAPAPAAAPLNLPDFVGLADQLSPEVVNISTSSEGEQPQFSPRQFQGPQGPGQGQDPFRDFWEPFERFFGPMPKRPFRQRSLGSGFIINQEGYILTNNHV